MRVLEIEPYGRGGLAHYAYNLAQGLASEGHSVVLLTARAWELEGHARPVAGLRVERRLARVSAWLPRRTPRLLASFVRKLEALADGVSLALLARRLEPDVVHLHSTNPVLLVHLRLLWIFAGRRSLVVATAHVVTPHEPLRFERAIFRRAYGAADLVVAHSDVDRARLVDELGLTPADVVVLPHGDYGFFEEGVEPASRAGVRARLGLAEDDVVALFFGYVREYKGLDVLLDAWPAVAGRVPAARLVVAGDPARLPAERCEELRRRARALGAVTRLEYVDFEDVPAYFAAADVLVMPYRRISQSGVLFLALSLGLPVVATRVGALPSTLEDGESGVLVEPDRPDELAAALARVLGDPELRARLAAGGLAVAEAHAWPAIAGRTAAAFEQRRAHRSVTS